MQRDGLNNHIVYSPEVLEFVRLSNSYCTLLEGLPGTGSNEFMERTLSLLSGIYSMILIIKQPEPVYDEGSEKYVTEQDWSVIFQKIAQLMGPHNEYLRKVDEDEFDRSDLVTHTISEDLSDLYQELRDFTELFSRGLEEIMNDALWELMVNFEEHWGEKLINALSAMHKVYIKKVDLMEEDEDSGESEQDGTYYDNSMFKRFQDQAGEEE